MIDIDIPIERVPKERECLRCEKPFKSQGAGHRICSKCRQLSPKYAFPEAMYVKSKRKRSTS